MNNDSAVIIVVGIVLLTLIVTWLVAVIKRRAIDAMRDIYIAPLGNTDQSISDATKYLKLTNGLNTEFFETN